MERKVALLKDQVIHTSQHIPSQSILNAQKYITKSEMKMTCKKINVWPIVDFLVKHLTKVIPLALDLFFFIFTVLHVAFKSSWTFSFPNFMTRLALPLLHALALMDTMHMYVKTLCPNHQICACYISCSTYIIKIQSIIVIFPKGHAHDIQSRPIHCITILYYITTMQHQNHGSSKHSTSQGKTQTYIMQCVMQNWSQASIQIQVVTYMLAIHNDHEPLVNIQLSTPALPKPVANHHENQEQPYTSQLSCIIIHGSYDKHTHQIQSSSHTIHNTYIITHTWQSWQIHSNQIQYTSNLTYIKTNIHMTIHTHKAITNTTTQSSHTNYILMTFADA